MIKPYISVVIGKGFGDEGKGMATDFLASRHEKVLVVRHNGGAQSGHTVELPDKRFVFHELSSGSFRMADTFWAKTFYPDMYKLSEEVEDFKRVCGGCKDEKSVAEKALGCMVPKIYADINAQVTIIDDVLINMAAETFRGNDRHGSCGMGIYEAVCRGEAGYGITIGELLKLDFESLVERLLDIRREYVWERLRELGVVEISCETGAKEKDKVDSVYKATVDKEELTQYIELLADKTVLENFAYQVLENLSLIIPVSDVKKLFEEYELIIFENGQGLLLDTDNEKYAPHVSASKTGLYNPCSILKEVDMTPDEVVYVTRSYVTRHGAGHLPNECDKEELGIMDDDKTNIDNPWQGSIRYARHDNVEAFADEIKKDMRNIDGLDEVNDLKNNAFEMDGSGKEISAVKCMLMITHLDETKGKVMCGDEDMDVEKFCNILRAKGLIDGKGKGKGIFDGYYLSWSRYGDVKCVCQRNGGEES